MNSLHGATLRSRLFSCLFTPVGGFSLSLTDSARFEKRGAARRRRFLAACSLALLSGWAQAASVESPPAGAHEVPLGVVDTTPLLAVRAEHQANLWRPLSTESVTITSITNATSTNQGTIPNAHFVAWNNPALKFWQAARVTVLGSTFPALFYGNASWNVTSIYNSCPYFLEFAVSGSSFEIAARASERYRLWIDGRLYSGVRAQTVPGTAGAMTTIKFTFATAGTRKIRYESSAPFGGVRTENAASFIGSTQVYPTWMCVGDSLDEGNGTYDGEFNGFVAMLGQKFGVAMVNSGSGGTGYSTNGGLTGRFTYIDRIQDVTRNQPAVLFVNGTVNGYPTTPGGVTQPITEAMAGAYYDAVRNVSPNTRIIVRGPIWPKTPVPEAILAARDAIAAACAARGILFIDALAADKPWFNAQNESTFFGSKEVATATAVVTNGVVTAVTSITPSSGWDLLERPSITFAGPGSGARATAQMNYQLTAVEMLYRGTGYTNASVSVTGGGGSGASAEAVIQNGAITGIVITSPGVGFTSRPQIIINGDGTGAVATAFVSGTITGYTVTNGGSGYAAPVITISTSGDGTHPKQNGYDFIAEKTVAALPHRVVQTVDWTALANRPFTSAPIPLTAVASSGLSVAYSVVSGPAVVVGDQLQLTGEGRVVIRATQSGDSRFAAASLERAFVVGVSPEFLMQPRDLSVATATSGVFSVSVTGSGPLTYQWQRRPAAGGNWVNLPADQPLTYAGVDTARLLVFGAATAPGNSGDLYRCVVSNLLSSVTSAQATLTVGANAGVGSSAGGLTSTRFIRAEGSLWVSGGNANGELGDGTVSGRLTPAKVATDVVSVSMGFDHGLYVTADGRLFGSGYNFFGALGVGDTVPRATPVQIATDVSLASGGYRHTLFRKRDGTLWGMGWNPNGQLGDNSTTNRFTPQKIADNVGSFAAGFRHSMYVKFDGTVWATGDNTNGVFGDGATSGTLIPRQIAANTAVIASFFHTLFIRHDGSVWSTGRNDRGQVGDGTTGVRRDAVQITDQAVAVAVGQFHSLVLKRDGTLWATGANDRGQLGDGTTVDRSQLVLVATQVATISAGVFQSYFVKTDGTLWAMGANEAGQLGDGTTTDRRTPVMIASGPQGLPYFASFNAATNSAAADRVQLRWSWPVGATHFELWRNTSNDSATATLLARIGDNYYEDMTAVGGVTYHYWLKAFSPAGTLGLNTAVQGRQGISVVPPAITTPPQNQTAMVGQNFTFTVVATGAGSYQWYRGETLIEGATAATYTATASSGLAGEYRVVVANSGGSVASAFVTLTVNKLAQTVTFSPLAEVAYTTTPLTLVATATSDLPVALTLLAGPATLVGDQLTVTGVGAITLRASQGGNADYAPAPVVERSITVVPAAATVTLANLVATYDGTAKPVTATTDPSGLNVTFSYGGDRSAPTSAGSYVVVATVDSLNHIGTVTDVLVIAKAPQTIAFAGPSSQPFSLTPLELTATASSGLPVSFSVVNGPATISGSTLTLAGAGTITVRATQAGDANRAAAPVVERSFTVSGNYQSWLISQFSAMELLDSTISGPNADPDGDGWSNLIEYALGWEPRGATNSGLPEIAATATDWTYTYTRPANRPEVILTVEVSTNLAAWTNANVTHELVSTDSTSGVQTWRARYPLSSAANAFFRLRVTLP